MLFTTFFTAGRKELAFTLRAEDKTPLIKQVQNIDQGNGAPKVSVSAKHLTASYYLNRLPVYFSAFGSSS